MSSPLVYVAMMSFNMMEKKGVIGTLARYDFAMNVLDDTYKIESQSMDLLKRLELLDERGAVHRATKDALRSDPDALKTLKRFVETF